MAKRRGSSDSGRRTRSKAAEERRDESIQRLDKLPQELWEKILDNLKENDLFPLALSCRRFRQKQKELVARQSRRESGKPRRALRTNLKRKLLGDQPVSADYLRFCSQEKVSKDVRYMRDKTIRRLAALHGYLPLLQELLEPANELDKQITGAAAAGGQLKTLQWLKTQKGFKLHDECAFAHAASGGHLKVLKWLWNKGCPCDESACEWAARGCHLETLKWLRSEGCPWDSWTCTYAAEGGHLEVLKWLRSEGCPWEARACAYAARGGHLETLKWLRSEGCPWNAGVFASAAEGGHLEVLKWLRSEGCPWNERTCARAAYGGHLEVLKWLRSEGCPWDEEACTRAAWRGHLDVLRWAIDNGCPHEVNMKHVWVAQAELAASHR